MAPTAAPRAKAPPKTLPKDVVLQQHWTLARTRSHLATLGRAPADAWREYDKHAVKPAHVGATTARHVEACRLLEVGIARCLPKQDQWTARVVAGIREAPREDRA